jgi:hypothetical protein
MQISAPQALQHLTQYTSLLTDVDWNEMQKHMCWTVVQARLGDIRFAWWLLTETGVQNSACASTQCIYPDSEKHWYLLQMTVGWARHKAGVYRVLVHIAKALALR